jgi:hypothetical protein
MRFQADRRQRSAQGRPRRKASVSRRLYVACRDTKQLGFQMKGIVAIGVAVGVLWLADVQLNDGRYSEVVVRATISLRGK